MIILLLLLLLVYRLLFPRLCGSDVLPMMSHLHFSRSLAISGFNPMSFISPTNRAPQVILGLPLPLLPTTSIFLQALTQSSSAFRSTCPNHLNLPRLITSTTPSTPSLFLSSTVGTLSFNVTPHIHLNITFSFLCILCSSSTLTAQVSLAYTVWIQLCLLRKFDGAEFKNENDFFPPCK